MVRLNGSQGCAYFTIGPHGAIIERTYANLRSVAYAAFEEGPVTLH